MTTTEQKPIKAWYQSHLLWYGTLALACGTIGAIAVQGYPDSTLLIPGVLIFSGMIALPVALLRIATDALLKRRR